jgi:hypothetical protein
MNSPKKSSTRSVSETAMELAEIFKEDPSSLEKSDLERGTGYIMINEDLNFGNSFRGLKEFKIESICTAIDDLASGADKLRSGIIGVTFFQNKLQTFYSTHDQSQQGTVVFSIALKRVVAFKNWRLNEGDDVDQDEINYSIYFLTHLLSKLI